MERQGQLLGSPDGKGHASFSPGMEMRWLLDCGAELTQEKKMHEAEGGGRKGLGP